MTMLNIARSAGLAFAFATVAVSGAIADTEHTTKVACYASVQTQCYGNGANNCSDAEYQEGLGWCDQYYPSSAQIDLDGGPQIGATNIKATPTSGTIQKLPRSR